MVVPCLDVIKLVSREKYIEVLFFARKAPINTERVPPGHPIILLKSNKFNMAAVSVKRSITVTLVAPLRNESELHKHCLVQHALE